MTTRFVVLAVVLAVLLFCSVALGSVSIGLSEIADVAFALLRGEGDTGDAVARAIIQTVRIPRTVMALTAGAALGISGLLMQTVFRNVLAGPGVLGVTSGAGLGVAIVLLTGASFGIEIPVAVAAVGGALTVLVLALIVNRIVGEPVLLLVLGLLFGYAASAGTTLLMSSTPTESLERYVVWSFGSFAIPPGPAPLVLFGVTIIAAVVLSVIGRNLDVLLLGSLYAESSGIDTKTVQGVLILLAGVLTGGVTALAGPITFLGIAVPHLARSWMRTSRHRYLVPATILIGGSLGVAADIVSRAPWMDRVLPLNAVTALVGVPVVVLVLVRGGHRETGEGIGV